MLAHHATLGHYEYYFSSGHYDRRYPVPNPNSLCLIRRNLPENGHIIDFGCGSGRYLLALRDQAAIAAGFDFCPAALARLRQGIERIGGADNIRVLGPNPEDLERHVDRHGSADIILCLFGVLSHIEGRAERRELLRRLASLLKPGSGQLIISVPNRRRRFRSEQRVQAPNGRDEVRYVRRLGQGYVEFTYKLFDTNTFRSELQDGGFELKHSERKALYPKPASRTQRFFAQSTALSLPWCQRPWDTACWQSRDQPRGGAKVTWLPALARQWKRSARFRSAVRASGLLAAGMCLLLVFTLPAQLRAEGPPIDGVAGGRLERVLQRQRLIVGVKSDYPPWGMVAPDGGIVGLEADLAKDVADRLGVALELVSVTTTNRLRRLEDGAVDLVIATLGDTFERQQISALVRPHYYASGVNLLAPAGSPFQDWGQLRGRRVCLTDGAYYNRALSERYLLEPVVFPGTRDTLLALRDGRCVGWAFDDTALARLLSDPEWSDYRLAMPTILRTPWAIAVQKGEGDTAWGRFVADMVADWHRSGRLVDLQAKWGLPPNDFLAEQHALWAGAGEGGPVCARDEAGLFPPDCLRDDMARTAGAPTEIPGWGRRLRKLSGLDLGPLFDGYDRSRLVRGIQLTLGISLVSIAGSLAIAVIFAWIDAAAGPATMAWLFRLPLRCLVAVARMTPPILQLYILFFGLGGLLASGHGITLGGFLVASVVFSLYAGATNTVLLGSSLARLRQERPGASTLCLIPTAIERSYEGLVSTSVNIVKAAGLASTIALPETISVVNTIIAEGGGAGTMMNLLLVFYFLFVLTVLGLLRAAKGLVTRWM